MATLDEISKEKERLSEALARVDAQREKLAAQLGELEATERVLARYSKGTRSRKTASAGTPSTATKATVATRGRGRPRATTGKAAAAKRNSPSLGDQILALATGKTQQEIAAACKGVRTMSASPFPGTRELAASKSATASSTPRSRPEPSNALRSDAGKTEGSGRPASRPRALARTRALSFVRSRSRMPV
jgi:hypothetical protein